MIIENAFLGVDKPAGWTSQDIVSWIRKFSGIRKVGHTGTLDPMATGVMVLCLGAYTRLSQYVTATTKTYRAVVRLGIATDSQDAEGKVIQRSSAIPETLNPVENILKGLRGEIAQIPPMHSAIRVDGKRLYELARKGREVERQARIVQIDKLDALVYDPPLLHLDVVCSKGTYIRSLADEIGKQLACGGHLVTLRRTQVGAVGIDCCTTLAVLRSTEGRERIHDAVLDSDRVLDGLPSLSLTNEQQKQFCYGNSLNPMSSDCLGTVRVVNAEGLMLGIGRLGDGVLKPVRVIQNQ